MVPLSCAAVGTRRFSASERQHASEAARIRRHCFPPPQQPRRENKQAQNAELCNAAVPGPAPHRTAQPAWGPHPAARAHPALTTQSLQRQAMSHVLTLRRMRLCLAAVQALRSAALHSTTGANTRLTARKEMRQPVFSPGRRQSRLLTPECFQASKNSIQGCGWGCGAAGRRRAGNRRVATRGLAPAKGLWL